MGGLRVDTQAATSTGGGGGKVGGETAPEDGFLGAVAALFKSLQTSLLSCFSDDAQESFDLAGTSRAVSPNSDKSTHKSTGSAASSSSRQSSKGSSRSFLGSEDGSGSSPSSARSAPQSGRGRRSGEEGLRQVVEVGAEDMVPADPGRLGSQTKAPKSAECDDELGDDCSTVGSGDGAEPDGARDNASATGGSTRGTRNTRDTGGSSRSPKVEGSEASQSEVTIHFDTVAQFFVHDSFAGENSVGELLSAAKGELAYINQPDRQTKEDDATRKKTLEGLIQELQIDNTPWGYLKAGTEILSAELTLPPAEVQSGFQVFPEFLRSLHSCLNPNLTNTQGENECDSTGKEPSGIVDLGKFILSISAEQRVALGLKVSELVKKVPVALLSPPAYSSGAPSDRSLPSRGFTRSGSSSSALSIADFDEPSGSKGNAPDSYSARNRLADELVRQFLDVNSLKEKSGSSSASSSENGDVEGDSEENQSLQALKAVALNVPPGSAKRPEDSDAETSLAHTSGPRDVQQFSVGKVSLELPLAFDHLVPTKEEIDQTAEQIVKRLCLLVWRANYISMMRVDELRNQNSSSGTTSNDDALGSTTSQVQGEHNKLSGFRLHELVLRGDTGKDWDVLGTGSHLLKLPPADRHLVQEKVKELAFVGEELDRIREFIIAKPGPQGEALAESIELKIKKNEPLQKFIQLLTSDKLKPDNEVNKGSTERTATLPNTAESSVPLGASDLLHKVKYALNVRHTPGMHTLGDHKPPFMAMKALHDFFQNLRATSELPLGGTVGRGVRGLIPGAISGNRKDGADKHLRAAITVKSLRQLDDLLKQNTSRPTPKDGSLPLPDAYDEDPRVKAGVLTAILAHAGFALQPGNKSANASHLTKTSAQLPGSILMDKRFQVHPQNPLPEYSRRVYDHKFAPQQGDVENAPSRWRAKLDGLNNQSELLSMAQDALIAMDYRTLAANSYDVSELLIRMDRWLGGKPIDDDKLIHGVKSNSIFRSTHIKLSTDQLNQEKKYLRDFIKKYVIGPNEKIKEMYRNSRLGELSEAYIKLENALKVQRSAVNPARLFNKAVSVTDASKRKYDLLAATLKLQQLLGTERNIDVPVQEDLSSLTERAKSLSNAIGQLVPTISSSGSNENPLNQGLVSNLDVIKADLGRGPVNLGYKQREDLISKIDEVLDIIDNIDKKDKGFADLRHTLSDFGNRLNMSCEWTLRLNGEDIKRLLKEVSFTVSRDNQGHDQIQDSLGKIRENLFTQLDNNKEAPDLKLTDIPKAYKQLNQLIENKAFQNSDLQRSKQYLEALRDLIEPLGAEHLDAELHTEIRGGAQRYDTDPITRVLLHSGKPLHQQLRLAQHVEVQRKSGDTAAAARLHTPPQQ